MNQCDVAIIGAGAAGLMCAATAGYRGRRVRVLDHAPKPAAKIRISGGGKCNFTNIAVSAENYYSANPHFPVSALKRYTNEDFIALVERHGIEYDRRDHGRLYCRHHASDITRMLLTECDWAGVTLQMNAAVQGIEAVGGGFVLQTSAGPLQCESLVIATGGLAYPKLRASDFGLRIARQFDLPVVPPRPALVPLEMDARWQKRYGVLSGVSFDACVSCREASFCEPVLITPKGLSGPAILQISAMWREGEPITLNLFAGEALEAALLELKRSGRSLHAWLKRGLPRRFAQVWIAHLQWPDRLDALTDAAVRQLASQLQAWTLYPQRTAGYGKAEVSLGGVDTAALSSKTMMAQAVPGLFFIGEVVDVTGQLGGYNFQWAWSSGYAAGTFA
ncbi:hypothetical protein SAMN05443662_0067 [Sulfurivirga caldicuralii]|uniref:Flavoprotein, HI0933 family n=1 Tax=Sulfurivirga caldicuralii TaxID=364032 RepID=A0A1N6DDN2_9GAMM|nr:NAD(P)/FAD-dependent oxidoreductase [Sulfurivirga caldicuralii]SIN68939.1 hypothetical protein SAMN05443662_0067 [Sulfurivirga caldicuralii]